MSIILIKLIIILFGTCVAHTACVIGVGIAGSCPEDITTKEVIKMLLIPFYFMKYFK